jgi:hypothetical protein
MHRELLPAISRAFLPLRSRLRAFFSAVSEQRSRLAVLADSRFFALILLELAFIDHKRRCYRVLKTRRAGCSIRDMPSSEKGNEIEICSTSAIALVGLYENNAAMSSSDSFPYDVLSAIHSSVGSTREFLYW